MAARARARAPASKRVARSSVVRCFAEQPIEYRLPLRFADRHATVGRWHLARVELIERGASQRVDLVVGAEWPVRSYAARVVALVAGALKDRCDVVRVAWRTGV